MRPAIGQAVIYTRSAAGTLPAVEFAAVITRVERRGDFHQMRCEDENAFDVHLAVFLHTQQRAETWFTPSPVRHGVADNTWRYPTTDVWAG